MDKQHILDEIRRTADANGGSPLGTQRFEKQTGIRKSDWYAKYWRSWGEAVREAGYEPNRLVSAYDEQFLIQKLAELTRELGCFPTEADIRMKARDDHDFPSHSAFGRVGRKSERARRVIEYCEARGGLDDVVEACRSVGPTQTTPAETAQDGQDEAFGYVYLLKSGKHFKIGFTKSVARRKYELDIQLPERAKLVHEIKTDDPPGIEAYWHKRFAAKRKRGEWFTLSAKDVAAFKRRIFM